MCLVALLIMNYNLFAEAICLKPHGSWTRGSDATDRTCTYRIERKIRMFWVFQNVLYWDQFTFAWIVSLHVSWVNRFMIFWIHSRMTRLKNVWITSWNLFDLCWIDSKKSESFQSSSWALLNRVKDSLSRINRHCLSGLSLCCLNRFTRLVNQFTMLFLAEFLHFPPISIYTLFLITLKSLNHLQLFSLECKNLKVHKFFKIKHFF